MNVLIISAMDPSVTTAGGTRPYILNIIKALSGRGVNFSVWGISYKGTNQIFPDFNFTPLLKKNISNRKFLISMIFKILLKGIPKESIIHAQRSDELLPFMLFRKKNPKIITIHGRNSEIALIYKKGMIIGNILKLIDRFVIKRADKIILVDERSKNYCLGDFPESSDKMKVISVGVDTTKFKPMDKQVIRKKFNFNENDRIIMFNGRFNKEKQLDILIKSFKIIREKIQNCKLILIGDGPEIVNLKNQSEGIDGIIFTGLIAHEDIPDMLNLADVFVLTSLFEGMPTVVLEALACGIPVVSTDVGDVNKVVINGETGYIVTTANENEISEKLIEILTSSMNYSDKCVQIANHYSYERIGEKIFWVYNEVLKAK